MGDVSRFERYVSTVTGRARNAEPLVLLRAGLRGTPPHKLTINYGLAGKSTGRRSVNGAGTAASSTSTTGEVLVAGSNGVGLDLNVEAHGRTSRRVLASPTS